MFHSQTQDGYSISVPASFNGYKMIEFLGCGGSCIVILVENEKTHIKYAAKIISIDNAKSKNMIKSLKNEIKVLKELDHPNIIKIQDSFKLRTDEDNYIVIVMEYCNGGDLLTHTIKKLFKNENEKKKIIYQVLDAIRYLHEKGISHGDIKSENILLDSRNCPKLCDFGFSISTPVAGDDSKNGTLYYAAPELFVKGQFKPMKADIWAVGITLYSLYELQFPFKDGKKSFIVKQIMSGRLSISKSLDPKIREIVEACTNCDPNKRPTIEEILQTDFFDEVRSQKLSRYEEKNNNNLSKYKKVKKQLPEVILNDSDSNSDQTEVYESVFAF